MLSKGSQNYKGQDFKMTRAKGNKKTVTKSRKQKLHPALRPLKLKGYSRLGGAVSESGAPVDWGSLSDSPASRYKDTMSMSSKRESFLLEGSEPSKTTKRTKKKKKR